MGWILQLLLLALIVWLIWRVVAPGVRREPDRRDRDDSLVILRERLARGEIDSDEYERLRRVLEG